METMEIFKNYGVLGAEKRNIYTYGGEHAHAVCSDKITVEIPEGWELWEDRMGREKVTAPWGWDYEINDVLAGNERPEFLAHDKDMELHHYKLNVVQRER